MPETQIRPKIESDASWVSEISREYWGAETVIAHGEVFHPADLNGFIAWQGNERVGLITFISAADSCEIITLNVLLPNQGIGSMLIATVVELTRQQGCAKLQLVTTNDNTRALRFYQKQGFRLSVLRPGAVSEARMVKTEIPLIGEDGIPIRDEIELELAL